MANAKDQIQAAFSQADELAAIEEQAQKAATSTLAAEIDRLMGRAAGAVTLSPEAWRALLEPLQRAFEQARQHASAAVQKYVPDAFRMGLKHAAAQVGLELPLDVVPPPVQDNLARLFDEQLVAARVLLRSNDDIVPALAVARRAVPRVDGAITWQVNRAAADGVQQTADQFGLARRWVAERDACLHCLSYQGEVAGPGEQFAVPRRTFADKAFTDEAIPNPPLHPHCFPAGVIVSGPRAEAATKRWYEGDVVEIRTRSGAEVTVTPNHPMLTAQGWVAAGLVVEGTELIRDIALDRVLPSDPHGHQQPALIEDVASSIYSTSSMAPMRVPVSAVDFHGDGIAETEVEIVRPNSLLGDRITIGKPLAEQQLSGGGVADVALLGQRDPLTVLRSLAAPANSGMGGRGVDRVLLRAATRSFDEVLLTLGAELTELLFEEPRHRDPGYPLALGDALQALSGLVAADQVVSVHRRPFADHVYNLQTEGGWYTANKFIVHNCRCVIQVHNLADRDVIVGLRREARRSVAKGWSLPSESQGERLRAADKLLRRGADLPKTVEEEASRAVKRGEFRSRIVPSGQ